LLAGGQSLAQTTQRPSRMMQASASVAASSKW
jgi:hypothetical protein